MKTCSYCGRENEDAFVMCRECGTEFNPVEPAPVSRVAFRRVLIIAAVILVATLACAVIMMPYLLVLIPLAAVFYLPTYLPFLLSFTIKAPEWRGMKWALRIGSLAAFFLRSFAMAARQDFGNDVAGNIAGAGHNLFWTWGVGVACAFVAVTAGLLMQRCSLVSEACARK